MAQKRLNREEKKAETRSRLLTAAAQLFALRGFGGASIEEIAESAGYSRGAFYSNFSGKEELLVELFEMDLVAQEELRREWAAKESADADARAGGSWLMDRTEVELILMLEFVLKGARDPEFAREAARYWSSIRAGMAEHIERRARAEGQSLPAPSRDLASVVIGMGVGFALQHMIDPDEVPATVYPKMLALFFTGTPPPDWEP